MIIHEAKVLLYPGKGCVALKRLSVGQLLVSVKQLKCVFDLISVT